MRGSYTRKKIKGIMYTLMIREDKHYANRAAKMYRDEGYRAVVLPCSWKANLYEVWRSVNKLKKR